MKRFILVGESVRENLKRHIDALDLTQKPVLEVNIKQHKKNRSNEQNAYIWGVVYKIISDHTGYECEEVHELLKRKFIQPKVIELDGEEIEIYSTKKLSTQQFSEYVEQIARWCAGMGVYIPKPGEDYERVHC